MSKRCIQCSAALAGVYTAIQGLIWAIVTIYGVAIFTCKVDGPFENAMEDESWEYRSLLYFPYLRGSCRPEKCEADAARRTYYLMMIYSVISAVWIPASVLVTIGSTKKVKGKNAKYFYVPWILMTSLVCLLDVVATVYYSIDISNTLTTPEFFKFIKCVPPSWKSVTLDGITVLPAVIMTLIASRGVVLWLINFFLIGFAIITLKNISKDNPLPTIDEKDVRTERIPIDSMGNKNWGQRPVGWRDNHGFVTDSPDLRRGPNGSLGRRSIDEPQRVFPVAVENRPAGEGWNSSAAVSKSPNPAKVYDVYGKPTNERITPPALRRSDSGAQSDLSGFTKPWSYTQPTTDITRLKFQAHVEGVEKPPIPVPDYSVRVTKKPSFKLQIPKIIEPE